MFKFRSIIVLLLTGCLLSCANAPGQSSAPAISADSGAAAAPWTSLAPLDDPNDFHFVVVTDRTGGHRPGVFSSAMPKVNLLAPAFVVSVGDLIEGYTEDQAQIDAEWDEMEGFIGQLDAPFFYTAGNHDMNNAVMAEEWKRRFGPSYYHFKYKDVLFLVLNSELFGMVGSPDKSLPGPWKQSAQMAFVEQVLAEHGQSRWTVVLIHQPLWDAKKINKDWLRVESLLGDRPYTVFAGHFHQYAKHRRHDRNYITLATTGGISGLRGPVFGEFDHVAWVTMTEGGPKIANLALDGIFDEDVSNKERHSQAQAIADSLQLSSHLDENERFTRAQQAVQIRNPTDQEMTVSGTIAQPGNFDVGGLRPLTIAGGESETLTLELSSDTPLPYRDLAPALIKWTLTANIEQRLEQVVAQTPLLPLAVHRLPYTKRAPKIDGDLSDWGELRYVVDRQGDVSLPSLSAADLSYRFDVRYDDSALYVGVAVKDDDVQAQPIALARNQDAIFMAVDTRPDAKRNASMSIGAAVLGGDMANTAVTIQAVEGSGDDELLGFMAETASVTQSQFLRTATGYQAEFAIPMGLLNEKSGSSAWQEARIVVSVYDLDEGEHAIARLHWQPDRYGSAPLSGSHTFRKSP